MKSLLKNRIIKSTIYMCAFMAFISLFIACSDEKGPTTTQAEHFDATGLVLESDGARILTYYNLVCHDTLYVPIGLSDHITVKFLKSDSTLIGAPTDADKKLGWTIADTSMLEVYRHDGEEWEFHLKGKKVGTTYIEFQVLHVDHADFKTIKIPVVIRDLSTEHGDPFGINVYEEESGLLAAKATEKSDYAVKGSFSLSVGEITDHYEAKFFDEALREFIPDNIYKLSITMSDPTVAGSIPAGDEEPWAFKLQGIKAGETDVVFKLLQNGQVYKEFTPIRIYVK